MIYFLVGLFVGLGLGVVLISILTQAHDDYGEMRERQIKK